MRLWLRILVIAFLPVCAFAAQDTVEVTNHTIAGLKSNPTLPVPDIILIKLEVEYALKSQPKAILSLAIDKSVAMSFSTVDQKEVVADKGKKRIELFARLEKFSRDTLRGVVFLQRPDAPPGSPPLAMTGVSLDVKKFKDG